MVLHDLYRWCDGNGGGIVVAESEDKAREKLEKMYGENRNVKKMIIWSWINDDYYDKENPDVFDIY